MTYYVMPEHGSAAVSAVDSTSLCHAVASSRDGNAAYFSTVSAGSSRVFNCKSLLLHIPAAHCSSP
jgi:hypothetical protein